MQNKPFEHYIQKTDTCWIWIGSITGRDEYGWYKSTYAHRVAWRIAFGTIPKNMDVHHKCKNTRCVNPDHLEILTKSGHKRRHSRYYKVLHPEGSI